MAQQQQTVLRVQTNVPSGIEYTGTTSLSVTGATDVTYGGSGTEALPITGTTTSASLSSDSWAIDMLNSGGTGTFYYSINMPSYAGSNTDLFLYYGISITVSKASGVGSGGFNEYGITTLNGSFIVEDGDVIFISAGLSIPTGATMSYYVVPDVDVNNSELLSYDTLDLYTDIPLKLNKSFAELQDIGKRNSDYSVGLSLPGSKKNNAFFESYFNVDATSLYFDVTRRVNVDVLINDQKYFTGYMRLNKVSVLNSKVEYDVTLYSTVADLYGKMGNNLLKDLDYNDISYHFNHYFSVYNVMSTWSYNTLIRPKDIPSLWMYPVVHNGYEYTGDTVNLSGATSGATRLYQSTIVGTFTDYAQFITSGGTDYRINSPINPLLDNQLKPGLNIYALMQLMFKNYGYTIKSDFFNTPWFKLLYMYGFYSYDGTKFGYKTPVPQTLPLEGVDVLVVPSETLSYNFDCYAYPPNPVYDERLVDFKVYVVKKGTGIPAFCSDQINVTFDFESQACTGGGFSPYSVPLTIPKNTTGTTYQYYSEIWVDCGYGCPYSAEYINYLGFNAGSSNVGLSTVPLAYTPAPPNTNITFNDGNYVDFSLVIDTNIKQIDILSSIAKKFNLVIIPDPEVPTQFIIEPFDYYIGSGNIHDWTDKLSYDKGFSVQPALNFIESELILTDIEDGDEANKTFKDRNKLVYGENRVYNPTDFKSQTKKVETIFAPEVIRKWDNNIGIPLGINYAGQSTTQTSGDSEKVIWKYTGIKQKPRLFFNNGNLSPFLDTVGESYNFGSALRTNTMFFRLQPSNGVNPFGSTTALRSLVNPVVSHTMPMGNPDNNKINNDSICVLFNSQQPDDIGLGIPTFNAYTDQDIYGLFYSNRINNLYNKNTRFLSGQFNLKLSDIENIKPNDLIKIQEQYFILNKLEGFDLTNPELTKVELVQTNRKVNTYPIRYFKYQYCGDSNVYKFRTFFNPEDNTLGHVYSGNGEQTDSIRRTYYYWSIYYDYFVGALGGNVSGFTSSYDSPGFSDVWAYTINEITETEYNTPGDLYWYEDNNNLLFIDRINFVPSLQTSQNSQLIWRFSNNGVDTKAFFNVAADCTAFSGYCSTNGVVLSAPPGSTPSSPYTTGATINVTDTGWIKYDTASGTVYKQLTTLGNTVLTDCLDCDTIREGIPLADLAAWTVVNCGNPC